LAEVSLIHQEDLFKKIAAFREALENRNDVLSLAKELYDILIKPISRELQKAETQTLMISLDGQLRYIPIAALHDGKKWLAEKYALAVYTEAARGNLQDVRTLGKWEAAAMGVTQGHSDFAALPAVRGELKSIVREAGAATGILEGTILLDEAFTESAFADALRNFPIVHVASHFRFEPGTIADSFLLLGDGEHLTLEDMRTGYYGFGNVNQLTLSACNTAMGSEEWMGVEVEGLGAEVQIQGAKSVVATLWNVADDSTGLFMSRFYTLLQDDGVTKAEALRQAQLYFIEGQTGGAQGGDRDRAVVSPYNETGIPPALEGYRHPYFWAPFILMGNWL
jgi:CHAT domain-containing protein